MTPERPNESIEFSLELDGTIYTGQLERGNILHEAFHQLLPASKTHGMQLRFRTESDVAVYPDNFLGDISDFLGTSKLRVLSESIPAAEKEWKNIGFDHLAITVADRPGARSFLEDVVQMQCMRDDPHLTVMTTGPTTLMLFDADSNAPLANGNPSQWHHLGFVVDTLPAAYAHLLRHRDRLDSDFTMLERDERWSLYFFYRNGDTRLMFQFSEVNVEDRGFAKEDDAKFPEFLYDYASRPYGIAWELRESVTDPPRTSKEHAE